MCHGNTFGLVRITVTAIKRENEAVEKEEEEENDDEEEEWRWSCLYSLWRCRWREKQ